MSNRFNAPQTKIMEKVYCKLKCGFEDEYEPDEFGINFYQAIGTCPNCEAPTIHADGSETAEVIEFHIVKN